MGLNAAQKQAVEYLEGPLLVIAGPGTGKTQLLSSKVAYILENTDTNPENILCMTFTESGARNMRERLRSMIGSDGLKVNIGTYHAFGADILAQYKNYAPEYERKLDVAIDEVTQFKIVKGIMAKLPGGDILRKDNVKDVVSVISHAKAAGLSSEDLSAIAAQNMEDSKVLSEAIAPLLEKVVPRQFKASFDAAYLPIYNILKEYVNKNPIIIFKTHSRPFGQAYGLKNDDADSKIERIIVPLAKDLEAAIERAERIHQMSDLTRWKNKYFEKDEQGRYRLKDRVANLKLNSVAGVMKGYDEYLREEGLYDFDDMIQEAVRALMENAGFRATMQERYQFIMLDEFQDTNPAQFAIIKALTDYEKPMVMAVGDDDQAIYEFQGALSTNMVDFRNHYGAKVITLTENYRSTQEVLDFAREIIRQAPDRFADKALEAHKLAPKKSQILRYEFLSSDSEYAWVAEGIAKLVREGVPQSEIAVISYKTKYFMPLLPYLKAQEGIKIAYEKRDDLFEDEQVRQILQIASFVAKLARGKVEGGELVEILAYPFWGLPTLEVVQLIGNARREKRGIFEYVSAYENPAITEVAQFLANLSARAAGEPLEIWLDYAIGATELEGYRSPFLKYYTGRDEFLAFTLYENLAALRGKVRAHFGEKKLRVADLVEMAEDYKEAGMGLNVSSPYREGAEAVQILSAHKAKGLEFRYVFIVSADHRAWGAGKGNNNLLALPKNLTQIRHTGMTDGERLRVLYVALTRAKDGLYITNSLHDFDDKSPERLEYLGETEDGEKVVSPFLPTKNVILEYGLSAPAIMKENLKNWLTAYAQLTPEMREIYRERVADWRMSASSLTSFIDIAHAGPQEFFRNYILRAPREPETEALALGNLMHATFEAVTNKGLSDEAAVEFFLDALEREDLPAEIAKVLREKGPRDLTAALARFGDLLRRGEAEVNLAPEKLVVGGVPVTGKIDHIIIDEKTKTLVIYDFKTGNYRKNKWKSHATLYKYMLQLEFYKLLLAASTKYRKYRIDKAEILFVVPDNDGEVHVREYEFSKEDEAELLKLMQAVYKLVTSLKFMDDADVFVGADEKKGLKDIFEFTELLFAKADSL